MVGQGSPNRSSDTTLPLLRRRKILIGRLATAMVVVCLVLNLLGQETALGQEAAPGEAIDLRLRASWSTSLPRQFYATLSITEGEFLDLDILGLGADLPGAIYQEASPDGASRRIIVDERSPQSFNGFDITLRAPSDAIIRLEFRAKDGSPLAFEPFETTVAQLKGEALRSNLAGNGGLCSLGRAPGDRLRVEFNRPHLIFSPQESATFRISPHFPGLVPGTNIRMVLSLTPIGDEDASMWEAEHILRVDAEGGLASVEETLSLPLDENVYNLRAQIIERPSIPIPFARQNLLLERQVQMVVISDTVPLGPPLTQTEQVLVEELDPTEPRFWERIPHWHLIPGRGPGPFDNDKVSTLSNEAGAFIQLAEGGWQAYPLSVEAIGKPHIVEIEYPLGAAQTLGISVVQPNAAGQIIAGSPDSGVVVEPSWTDAELIGRHRLVFWPKSESPLLLLTNRSEGGEAALFGRIRVVALGDRLGHAPVVNEQVGRHLLALYDQPLFPQNFAAEDALDPRNSLRLDDWKMFHQGSSRLFEYLHYVGYSGSIINVMSEGSALYPSELLASTPTHDTGAFFSSAQDLMQKDVVEMLFRQCDACQLTMIPLLHFSTPLPELEAQLRGENSEGIALLDLQGRSWVERHGSPTGEAPYYNLLDSRVQQAMLHVVDELLDRYAEHDSMSGVAIQLSAQGYTQLQGITWGCDDRTLRLFMEESGITLPLGNPAQTERALRGEAKAAWLAWRAARLANFYSQVGDRITAVKPDAHLYLTPTRWADRPYIPDEQHLHRALHPTLPQNEHVGNLFLELGIDPTLYEESDSIIFFRPHHSEPGRPLSSGAVDLCLAENEQLDTAFAGHVTPAALFMHRASNHRLPDFDSVSPFGNENTFLATSMRASPHGRAVLQPYAHAMAKQDSLLLAEGGSMLAMGQEAALTEWIDSYRRLPREAFETVQGGAQCNPVVLRTLLHAGRRYVYLVNDSAWPVTVDVALTATANGRMQSLSPQRPFHPFANNGFWQIRLKPYELVAGYFTDPEATIDSYEVHLPEGLEARVRHKIDTARARLVQLANPPQIDLLANPDFEMPLENGGIPHWEHAETAGIEVTLNTLNRHSGDKSLAIESNGPIAWVRSAPIELPSTGRIAITAWLRIDDPRNQPPLQIAIDGYLDGRSYYRSAQVGAGEGITPLTTEWAPYVFQLDDIPAQGLSSLRVGIDLMGEGKVYADRIEVDHLVFTSNERRELTITLALADLHLTNGRLADASRVIEGYWPRFLEQHIPLSEVELAGPLHERETPSPDGDANPAEEREAALPWWNNWQWPF